MSPVLFGLREDVATSETKVADAPTESYCCFQSERTLSRNVNHNGEVVMNNPITDTYKGWTLSVTAEKNMCANFSFDITSPSGHCQHIAMGGDNEQRAMERAKEMIDLEKAMIIEE
jgi:hypothetical protein